MAGPSWLRAVGVVAALVGATADDAAAQGYAPPAVDTMFFTSESAGFRVVEVSSDSATTQGGQNRTTWIDGLVASSLTADERARLAKLFPLTPGGRLDYGLATGNYRSRIALVVQAPDTLDVGGKPVPVICVTRHHKGEAPSTFEGEYTMWYSAAHGLPLKLTYRHIAGEKPNFRDWQVVHIAPPGSLDGIWSLRVQCSNDSYVNLTRAIVRDGVIVGQTSNAPNTKSITDHDLRLTRVGGDQIEFKGTAANAGGGANTVSARGTLMSGGSVAGSGIINTRTGTRSGCSFSGERY